MRRVLPQASNARSFLLCKQDLTRFPLLGDLFRQVNFNERLIRNIFFIGQDLELIEHLAGQSKRIDFTGASMPGSNSISTRLDLEKSK